MDSIGKINKILASRGMTGADLTRMIGASSGAYSNWNRGKSKISSVYLNKIALALDVPVDAILPDAPDAAQDVTDAETSEILEYIRTNPGMRILFSKMKNATPAQLLTVAQMIEAFKRD